MMQFDISTLNGDFKEEYETLEEFIEKRLGKDVPLSDRMVSGDGVNVIYPTNQEARDAIEKHVVADMYRESIDRSERYSHTSTLKIICEGLGIPENDLFLLCHKSLLGKDDFYIDNKEGRFFALRNDDLVAGMNDFIDKTISANSKLSIGTGSIGRQGISSITVAPNLLLVCDALKTANSINDIMARPPQKNMTIDISLDGCTGNEDNPGTVYPAFRINASGNEGFIKLVDEAFEYFDGLNESSGFSFQAKIGGFCNSENNPIDVFETQDYMPLSDIKAKTVMMVSKSSKNLNDAFQTIVIDKDTMHQLGCSDQKGVHIRFNEIDSNYELIKKSAFLEANKIYTMKSIRDFNPVSIDPASVREMTVKDHDELSKGIHF